MNLAEGMAKSLGITVSAMPSFGSRHDMMQAVLAMPTAEKVQPKVVLLFFYHPNVQAIVGIDMIAMRSRSYSVIPDGPQKTENLSVEDALLDVYTILKDRIATSKALPEPDKEVYKVMWEKIVHGKP